MVLGDDVAVRRQIACGDRFDGILSVSSQNMAISRGSNREP